MSLGHMTTPEQLLTIVSPLLILGGAMAGKMLLGGIGLWLGGIGLVIIFIATKAWIWQHTVYRDGFENPRFVWNPADSEEVQDS